MILAWIITILVIKQRFSSSIIASPSSNWYSTVRTSLSPSLLYLLIFFNYLFLFKVYHIHLIFKWAGSSWLLCHSDMSSSFFFFFLSSFSLPGTTKCSGFSCIFPALNQPFPQGPLVPLAGELCLETKSRNWVCSLLVVSLHTDSYRRQS